jgi:hypothetical protein
MVRFVIFPKTKSPLQRMIMTTGGSQKPGEAPGTGPARSSKTRRAIITFIVML